MTFPAAGVAHGRLDAPRPFRLDEPLAEHTTVLEASAGTGKTYAIVGIAARHIAEGLPIDKLLLVTFSRSATAELRERMRDRLAGLLSAIDARDDAPDTNSSPTPGGEPDELLTLILAGDAETIALRRDRLARALSDFDASTIATTHTFCNRMLEALGFLGERELVYEIVEDVDDLVEETALDLYLRGFGRDPDDPVFTFDDAVTIAKEAVRNPAVDLVPAGAADAEGAPRADRAATRRVNFCRRVREIVERRKRESRLRTYDDLQMILYRIVIDENIGDDACARIRDTFELILVDEFQDTDPLQWEILRRCFHGQRRLVLVGDPKQSIYAFRGAEILSYLDAVRVAGQRLALDTNWRSDENLVEALFRIYGGANLGNDQITVHQVNARRPGSRLISAATGPDAQTPDTQTPDPRHPDTRTPDAQKPVPSLRVRWFRHDDFPVLMRNSAFASVNDVRAAVIADVAADVASLLASGTHLSTDSGIRAVHPGDIAILVSANRTIEPLQNALGAHGIGSVVGTGTSVFATMSARHWLWMLRAIESPSRNDRVALAALTPLIGWDPDRLAGADDAALTELAAGLADLARTFDDGGFAAMAQRILADHGVAGRVLAGANGERMLTDLLQVSTVCNRHVVEEDCGLSSLSEWLADRIADESLWRRSDEQTRRLDRDTQVVQIMTVHASKGLQFPIVYVPFGWDGARNSSPKTFRYHDDNGERHLDVGGQDTTGRPERLRRSVAEDAGEDLRKLYVALTRAGSQVVAWWAPSRGTSDSALHRLIFGHPPGYMEPGTTVAESVRVPDPDECEARLVKLGAGTDTISVESAGGLDPGRWVSDTSERSPEELSAAVFGGRIDSGWRRTSYSAIIAAAGHASLGPGGRGSEPEPEAQAVDDEPVGVIEEALPIAVADDRAGTPSPMNGMPFGAAFGILVHETLEYVDTSAPDRRAHVRELCERSASRYGLPVDADALTSALDKVLTTPLGFGDLWSVGPRDRLAELDFEMPLGPPEVAGDDPLGAGAPLAAIADLMDDLLPEDDLLRPYVPILASLPTQRLRGFLTGSIDSVLRIPDGRFVVVDYKTNRLHPGALMVEDFSAEAMAAEMIRSHYPLQALLYSVALHRYLRWRLPGYAAASHLGPVQYHFVRGMAGPSTPPGCGVFEWSVPPELITALSDLLAGVPR
ncbi:UvrD-helicase domain-containing protein [Gordonia polyisoprenivorans]|uniref:UvrD-helicase domain-containing protein n=1 Tax=Gordonia polyisoprenivorans TaxID=84595 RepID=UPI001AD7A09E|nr:UvrD-helicase domain-containing protein [Gordonia polyisoprenivorans]QTI67330.1 UvrD-helicase domain-containing protein [Gordonia polyisoprenivorans]